MPSNDSKLLLRGAFILTIAAIITKILSAVYRVPFQNIVGDIGFYIYQQVYPIYGIAIALTTYGFPVIISKLVAEAELNKKVNSHDIIHASFIFIGVFGLLLFSVVFFGAELIAGWMGDQNLTPLIKVVSFTFLLVPFISTIRGYFQGKGDMLPTAISQVQEQLIRVSFILVLSYILMRKGSSLYLVGGSTLISSIGGSLTALITLLIFYFRSKKNNKNLTRPRNFYRTIGSKLFIQGTAVCISGALLVLFQFVDSLNIFSLLVKSGIETEKAKELKGIFDRGQPLIQLGAVVATSFSLTLVPSLSSKGKEVDQTSLIGKINIALKLSVIVGLGATIGIISIMEPTNILLFSNNEGTRVLQVFAVAIIFSSMILTITGIFQGMGYLITPAKYIILGILFKFIGNYVLIPKFGTMGASLSTVIALMITLGFCIFKLKKIGIQLLSMQFYIKISLCVLIMASILQVWTRVFDYFHLDSRFWSCINAFGGVSIGGVFYLFTIGAFKLLDDKEVSQIPFGKLFTRSKR
ncbi:putative polysaccharide biosynthesis protein [Heyndrickxia sporothermodurans]